MIIAGKDRCIRCMQPLIQSGACSCCGFDENKYEQPSCAIHPGTCLHDRYFIGSVIGQGGFGITYIAWDIMLTVKVAIKEYYPSSMACRNNRNTSITEVIVQNNEYQSRYDKGLREFLREARILAQFTGLRGVVAIRDFFSENNTAYIAMEYVDGIPISSYVRRNGPFSGKQLLNKMEPILASLKVVHELGYLHRDISANNIMYMPDGQLKLIDFGAARMIENEDATITVSIKRGYSPSEQYLAKGKLGTWTDVYSLCATMYYMLTGKEPDDSIERVIEDKLKPLAGNKSIELNETVKCIIDKGMSVKPEERVQRIDSLYEVMYPDNSTVQEHMLLMDGMGDVTDSGKKKRSYSRTLLKKELDNIVLSERQYKRKKILIITLVLLVIVLLVTGGIYVVSSVITTDEPPKESAVVPTEEPTIEPTIEPTKEPTKEPTEAPTKAPTEPPTKKPTKEPDKKPTKKPTEAPVKAPTRAPGRKPVKAPDNNDDSVGTLDGL